MAGILSNWASLYFHSLQLIHSLYKLRFIILWFKEWNDLYVCLQLAVASDFSKVNVYWLAGEKEVNSEIEKLLFDMSLYLRHELSQLRIMGVVPRIEFVKG